MKDRPILFKPEMVRAIMDGKKTQTRRVVKTSLHGYTPATAPRVCPYGRIGDRLWVRETWSVAEKKFEAGASVRFKADDVKADPLGGRWRPSIHMPRAACRLRLEITDVRLERLWDITEEDAMAEGVELPNYADQAIQDVQYPAPSQIFFDLWVKINGQESMKKNPWVWVVTFKIHT